MEATPGIEPGYAVLQTAASPLRHMAAGRPGRRIPCLPDHSWCWTETSIEAGAQVQGRMRAARVPRQGGDDHPGRTGTGPIRSHKLPKGSTNTATRP